MHAIRSSRPGLYAAAAIIASIAIVPAGCAKKKKAVPAAPQAAAAPASAPQAVSPEAVSSSPQELPDRADDRAASQALAPANVDHESLLLDLLSRADQLTRISAGEGDLAERVRFSRCADAQAHGQRLFELLARDAWDYTSLPTRSSPAVVGQTLIMRTWQPVEVEAARVPMDHEGRAPATFAFHDGRWWRTGDAASTFIMHKLDSTAPAPGTDSGWIYGEQAVDGRMLSAGGVESCVQCHADAANDRLHGLK